MTEDGFVSELGRRLSDAGLSEEDIAKAVLAYQQTQLAVNGSPLGTWMTNATTGERAWRTKDSAGTPVWQVFSTDGTTHFDQQAVLQPSDQWT